MSGSALAAGYGLGLVLVMLVHSLVRRAFWRRTRPSADSSLSLDELAFLVGGPNRVVDAKVAGLVRNDVLRVQRNGEVSTIQVAEGSPLESLITGYAATRPKAMPLLRRVVRRSEPITSMRERLLRDGFLHVETQPQKMLMSLPYLVLLTVGGVLIAVSSSGVPVLIVLMVLTVFMLSRLSTPRKYRVSKAAWDLLRAARHGTPDRALPDIEVLAGAGGLVALDGLDAFPDPLVAAVLGSSAPRRALGSSACGSTSSCGCSQAGGGCGTS